MRPDGEPGRISSIELVGIGALPERTLEALAERLSRRVSVPCRARPAPLAFEPPRLPDRNGQADADLVLQRLESEAGSDGALLVGITAHDLAIPIFTFVFGRARHHGRAALVSLARLDPAFYGMPADDGLLARRAVDEILHELGHVAGLRHCDDYACLLHFSASVEKVDLRGPGFCAGCAARLPAALRRE
jgi:archaemetzincin